MNGRNSAKSIKIWNASRICVSSLRRGHANLLCIVPIVRSAKRYDDLALLAVSARPISRVRILPE